MYTCYLFIMYTLHINFCAISFNRTQDLYFPKTSGKTVAIAPPSKLCSQKLDKYHLAKLVYCIQNFVRFYAIESEIELPQEFWKICENNISKQSLLAKIISSFKIIINK